MSGRRAIVVGGGVIGVSCAHHLHQCGWEITVLDRGQIGRGCSHGNCGYVSPSHVLPLAVPGAVKGALSSMLQRNPPIRVRPRVDPALWKWLYRFTRFCNKRSMMSGGKAIQALLKSSMTLYQELMETGQIECEWQKLGLMMVYKTPREMDEFAKADQFLREHFDEPAERLDASAVCSMEPALRSDLAGGWYYEEDAHLRPDKLMSSWRELLERSGVVFREHTSVTGLKATSSEVTVQTANSQYQADRVIVATGAWTPHLQKALGCSIPIQPGKGYSITMPKPKVCPTLPMLFPEHRVGVTPMLSKYRLGSIMELAGYDESIPPSRVRLLTEGAAHYLKDPVGDPIEEEWYGWRPLTCDSVPIIGEVPNRRNVYLATGHNMLGLSMATATGKLVSEMLEGESPHIDPFPYRVNRW